MAEVRASRQVWKGTFLTPQISPNVWTQVDAIDLLDLVVDNGADDIGFSYELKAVTAQFNSTATMPTFQMGAFYYRRGTNLWEQVNQNVLHLPTGGPQPGQMRLTPLPGASAPNPIAVQVFSVAPGGSQERTYWRVELISVRKDAA